MKISLLLLLVSLPACFAYNATLGWQTLYRDTPMVIANGGSSGVYPDQTDAAYADAFNSTSVPLAFLCDLQLTKDNLGVCRTGWNLSLTTNLTNILTNASAMSTYVIQGSSQTAYFSVDFTSAELSQVTAIQHRVSRAPFFDGQLNITTPEAVAAAIDPPRGVRFNFWLNVEYPTFYQQHPGKNSLASYLTTFVKQFFPEYLSATEVGILKLLLPTAQRSSTNLVFKVLGSDVIEESTNTTYGQILKNLTAIATYAQGILVPKDLIYPKINFQNDSAYGYYSAPPTSFVQDAHKAGLEVFVYSFANDDFPSSYNYSFDPVREFVSYLGNTFNVDGFLTDFPTTAAEAIHCYPDGYVSASLASRDAPKSVKQPTIVSHNGASGDYPGCTLPAYVAAIDDGADYIDCIVQITSDGVPFCREDADLLKSTNVFSNQNIYQQYVTSYPELQSAQGVFSFDLSWADVITLKGTMYSPWAGYYVKRDPSNDNKESILTLDDFLSFAKNNSGIGVYVNLQNAYYLRTQHNLDMVDAVVTSLTKANLTNANDKILVASEDASALSAIQHLIPLVKLVYVVPYSKNNPISVTPPVLQEIKKYANTVALDRRLVDPVDVDGYFLASKTSVVSAAQALNMTVFYYFLSNEFNAYAADYRGDPILQIYSLLQSYKIDGFITDFPATLYNFLHKNYCYQQLGGKNISFSANEYNIFPVVPGPESIAMAPSPALSVAEPPVSYMVPASSPVPNNTLAPTPSSPSSATHLSASFFSSLVLIFALTVMF